MPQNLELQAAGYRDEILGLLRDSPAESLNVLSWLRILKQFRTEIEMNSRYQEYDKEIIRILDANAAVHASI